ncbi:MAG: exodeoxyribonuclease III [Hyphomicrobiales bacterium]|nr:exodeoxyribonuclease III [Hyphomicrobiales bacterium]
MNKPASSKGALKVATWNINSVRLRMPIVARYLREHSPDVLCLQETKVRDAEFPHSAFRELGYEHIEINGQKGYHGVATVARVPLARADRRDYCKKGDARHLSVIVNVGARETELHNFYVPAGGDEPDRAINPKFGHKLDFVDEMAAWAKEAQTHRRDAILVGDLNIAPLEHDVWSHKALLKVVSHTPIEVEKMNAAIAAGQWVDAMRAFVPHGEKLYSWWSYRSPDWARADKGRRLDHIWVSPRLGGGLSDLHILREARGWERPSDHVPVSVVISDK